MNIVDLDEVIRTAIWNSILLELKNANIEDTPTIFKKDYYCSVDEIDRPEFLVHLDSCKLSTDSEFNFDWYPDIPKSQDIVFKTEESNYSSVEDKSSLTRDVSTEETFTVTVTEGIKATTSISTKAEGEFLGSGGEVTCEFSLEVSLENSKTQTTSIKKNWVVNEEITKPPNSKTNVTVLITCFQPRGAFKCKFKLLGSIRESVAYNYKTPTGVTKTVIKSDNVPIGRLLKCHPNLPKRFEIINDSEAIYNCEGNFKADIGVSVITEKHSYKLIEGKPTDIPAL